MVCAENEWAFVNNFFAATIVDYLFDNLDLFKNDEKNFLIDIMTYNNVWINVWIKSNVINTFLQRLLFIEEFAFFFSSGMLRNRIRKGLIIF